MSAIRNATLRLIVPATVAALILAGGNLRAGAGNAPAARGTITPPSSDHVLARIPASLVKTGELHALRERLARDPMDAGAATSLAWRHIEAARRSGAQRYLGYAEAALAPWWRGERAAPPEVRMVRATVLQARHDFEGALGELRAVLRLEPRNAAAWLGAATVLKVTGSAERALAACKPLERISSALLAAACAANASAMTPRSRGAYARLADIVQRSGDANPRHRQWALWVLASLAAEHGETGAAARHYDTAIAAAAPDLNLVLAHADFLIDRGRIPQALQALESAGDTAPVTLRRAIAAVAAGDPPPNGAVRALRAHFRELALRGDTGQTGDEARFEHHVLGNTDRALTLAKRNFALHREPRDAALLLETAAANSPAETASARTRIEAAGLTLPAIGHP